jgi:hypothetical protein
MFCRRGVEFYAPVDGVVEEVIGGSGLSGGAELIMATPDRQLAFRFRHVQSGLAVGTRVSQGQVLGIVRDDVLDTLGALPRWAVGFPDGWQHLDLSVAYGTDQFSPQGGGGGNVSSYDWLQAIGYQGTVWTRTPGPPDANT